MRSLVISRDLRPRATSALVEGDRLHVVLADGRHLSVPLEWFEWLDTATDAQKADLHVIEDGLGIWWETIDEGLSVPWLFGLPHHIDE